MARRVRTFLAALTLSALSAVVSALPMTVTIEGIVGPIIGYDTTGVFGPPATDLLGRPFILKVTFDQALGALSGTPGVSMDLIGGPALSLPDPILDTTLTINGATVHIPMIGHAVMTMSPTAFDIYISSNAVGLVQNHVIMFVGSASGAFSADFGVPFALTPITGGEDAAIRTYLPTGGPPIREATMQLIGQQMKMKAMTLPVDDVSPLYAYLVALPVVAMVAQRRKRQVSMPTPKTKGAVTRGNAVSVSFTSSARAPASYPIKEFRHQMALAIRRDRGLVKRGT